MRIVISPAKTMVEDTDSFAVTALPRFLPRTRRLLEALRALPADRLQKLWQCSDKLAELNLRRLEQMDLERHLTPALLAYEGIQYRYMAPGVFTDTQLAYVEEHLRILSGFYGLLRPFDGVTPYRLEMQARLSVDGNKDLYAFWGDTLAKQLFSETDCMINLASKEYSVCVSKYLTPAVRFITCIFGEENQGKVVEKGTICKMARGEMVRYMAENSVSRPEELRAFDRMQFAFAEKYSDDSTYVFIRKAFPKQGDRRTR